MEPVFYNSNQEPNQTQTYKPITSLVAKTDQTNLDSWKGGSALDAESISIQQIMQAQKLQLVTDVLLEAIPATQEEIYIVREGIMSFAQRLLLNITQQTEQSICLSPISYAPILGMITKGLPHGEAKTKMLEALGCGKMKEARFHAALGAILKDITYSYGKTQIKIANGLALTGTANEFFIKTVKGIYQGEIFSVKENICDTINHWFSDKTKGKITKMVSPESIRGMGIGMLNGFSFNAVFAHQFSRTLSFEKFFQCFDNYHTPAMMMHQTKPFDIYKTSEFEMLELPYQDLNGKLLSQLIFLPKGRDAPHFADLLKKMTPRYIQDCRCHAKKEEVKVYLPRLEVNYEIDLLSTLKQVGCPLDNCLVNISQTDVLSLIKQKIILSNDEKGTRGGGATAGLASKGFDPTPVFMADHPFVLLIMLDDEVLFQATVTDASFLVTSQKAKELDQLQDAELVKQVRTNIPSADHLIKFLKENKDIQLLLDMLPSSIDRFQPKEMKSQMPPCCTKFDIVNYTSLTVGFDGNRNLMFDQKYATSGNDYLNFSLDNCQLVIFEKDDSYIILCKDIGSTQYESISIKRSSDGQFKFLD